jgi:lysozyme
MSEKSDADLLEYPAHLWVVGKAAYTGLKKWEGFKPVVYADLGGNGTIGYGHRTKAVAPTRITKAQADRLLQNDALRALSCLRSHVKIRLVQCEVDALIMLVFNIGCQAFADSHLLQALNRKDFTALHHEWMRWDHAGGKEVDGLKNRRAYEWSLFCKIPF